MNFTGIRRIGRISGLSTSPNGVTIPVPGCSNWQAWRIATALGISARLNLARFNTLQAYYSIAGRDLERELVPLLEAEKLGLLVWSPLAGGLLSGRFSRERQSPAGIASLRVRFPDRRQGVGRDAPDRQGARLQPGAHRPRLVAIQAGGHFGAHRC
jgi:aryl-alcohol dehydrogenase-like predicted oxidoreductase